MPPKKKEEIIDLSTLPPWFPLSVLVSWECSEENTARIAKCIYESNFGLKREIKRDEIIDYGKRNGMYLDPTQDKQKKDKNAAEIPTELTPELMAKMFVKFYEELNLEGRKDKKARLDAIAEGKDPALLKKADGKDKKPDAKDKKDSKKTNPKDAKGKVEEEEVKEEPPLDTLLKKECDLVYFVIDYPSSKEEMIELSKQGGGLDTILRIREKIIEHKSFEESEFLGKKEEDEAQLRNRLENYISNQDSEENEEAREALQQKAEKEEKAARDQVFIQKNSALIESFKEVRRNSKVEDPIRNTVFREVVCEFDEEFPIEETLKNITFQIYEEICNLSVDAVARKEWMQRKRTYPVKQPQKVVIEAPVEVIPEEQLKSPPTKPGKGAAPGSVSKDAKKETKDSKKPVTSKKELEEPKKEEAPVKVEPPKVEEKEPEFSFNFYEKQLNPVKEDHLTSGAILEAIVDEISHSKSSSSKKTETAKTDIESIFANFDSNFRRNAATIKPLAQQDVLDEASLGNPFHYVINEADLIALKSQEDNFSSQESVEIRQHMTFDRLKLPGLERNLMPPHPEKSEPLRKSEKAQIHPFVSNDISDFERFQLMELYEKMLGDHTSREWNFGDRIYEERFDSNILRQKLYQALLFDAEIFSSYYDKEDALLLGVYHMNPPGRIIRKKWTCPWKVLPNLENWITHFKENENNLNTNLFYNLDYQMVENLHEIIKFMYPNDMSVIMCSQFFVGDQAHNFYRVLKENLTFGIRKAIQQENPNSELWAVFENRTKLLVEIERLDQNPQTKSIKEDRTEKTEGVTEGGEGTIDQQSGLQKETILTGDQAAVAAEESKPVDSSPPVYGATFTLTLESGLIVKFLTNGDILQTISRSKKSKEGKYFDEIIKEQYVKEDPSETEKSRLITGKGSVIRYMKDGSIQILYANGNYAFNKKNSGTWITTNNKGLRKGRKIRDNSEFELDSIPSARKTDPETGCKILIREDKVMVIQYPDGTRYTTHKDGTRFLTSPDGNTITIEHNDFATVKIRQDPIKARMGTIIARGSSTAYQGFENIMDRSFDGRVAETFLPDGSRVVGYKEKRELEGYEIYEISNIHLLYEPEGSVLRFRSDGEVIIISANDRYELNEKGENREDNDIDYFLQLFGTAEDRKNGVYTAELAQNLIWTRDNEGNYFSISSSGEAKGKIAVSFDLNKNINEPDKPIPADTPDGLYIEPENNFLPPPEKVLAPRLFLIKNDETGSEYLSDTQLKQYFKIKEKDEKCVKMVEENVQGYHNTHSLTFLTSFSNYDKDKLKHIFVKIPSNIDIIPQTENVRDEPLKLKFLFRNLLRFSELDEANRQKLHEDLEKFVEWKKNQAKEANEFGLKERTEEHKEKEYGIQQKIIDSRRTTYKQENYQECLGAFAEKDFLDFYNSFSERLLASRKRKESENIIIKTRKSIIKHYNPLEEPPVLPEEIYPLDIKFSEVDYRDVGFVGNYYQSFPGMQFEKTLPNYDVRAILEEKDKLRKTQTLIKNDELGQEDVRKYSLSKSNAERMTESPMRTMKDKEHLSPQTLKNTNNPSWNMTRDKLRKDREEKEFQESQQYHQSKLPKFDVYGEERRDKEFVPSLLRPIAQRELNTKQITVESSTDRRIKISSMANRLHLHAPSVSEVRNQGTHTLSKLSLDKKYDRDSLMEKKDLMVTAAFADALKRDLLIIPVVVNFGKAKCGASYERIVQVKNEDPLPQRINVKQPPLSYITVRQKETGPIALGVTKDLIVTLNAQKDFVGPINCAFEIVSKHDIYKIQIIGEVVTELMGETAEKFRKSKLPPLNSESIGSSKKQDMSGDMLSDEASFPTFKYDRNTKLDMNLHHNKKKTDESYQSEGNI